MSAMMRLALWLGLLCATLLSSSLARAELRVVTTTSDLAALTKAIAGSRAKVTHLATPTQDPHSVDAKPSLALELAKADLLVVVGLDLEAGWLPTLLTGSRNGSIQPGAAGYLDASRAISPLDVPSAAADRSLGDVHPHGSPHYLLDPRRAVKVAAAIAARLSKLDPDHAADYKKGVDRLLGQLTRWQKHWEAQAKALRGQKVVAYHRSLVYLADWLGMVIVGYVEPRPGIPPNPRHVTELMELMKRAGVQIILQESFYPTSTSKLIAEKTGSRLLSLPGGTNYPAGESYLGYMNGIVKRLSGP